MKLVFEFSDYKRFLGHTEEARKSYERGFRSKLANFIGCQNGYISHVLNGQAHFSLEQALLIAKFLELTSSEQKYFLLLVEVARAGTTELQQYFATELKVLREAHLNIKERVGDSQILTDKNQSIYYSSWHYLAVHVLVSLGNYDEAKTISDALKIPDELVSKILLFLIQNNIVIETKGKLKPGLTQVHLNRESPLIRQHHTNWRIAAIQSIVNDTKTDIHYSTVSTLSYADAENLRGEMVSLIEKYVSVIAASKEETMYGFNLDFYNLIKK
jgi:uncharacterized protein (TIGR02147 family)